MDNVEIPEYFICPISLQIMKDPVTAATGITYDREGIEHWLLKGHNTICPVTKQPLPKDSELTPNNTLRRLIRAWCAANSANDVDQVPTPKPPMSKLYFLNLFRGLWLPTSQLQSLQNLERLATENESNRMQMVEAGVVKPIISFVVECHKKEVTTGLAKALNIFFLIRSSLINQTKLVLLENDEIIDALTWVLGWDNHLEDDPLTIKTHAISAMKILVQMAKSVAMVRLKPDCFSRILCYIREKGSSRQGINAALQIMLDSCSWGRNRIMMVEAGTVFELIELEFNSTEKKTTELILGILFHLCSCADGRAQFLSHAAGVAVVTKRILKVSPAADARAMLILLSISKFSGTVGVLQEMLRVGAVAKLCMVIQANCESYLKDKAREILRTHSSVWKDSPCIDIPTLTSDKISQLTL
ncbi:hypothetical protein ACH5RR_004489 [Cinchona calisaya]|uniref:U-box domain-containing protein n=1 Tax=Cinchona calisaya TaxID=153742 RepID=A0ABD3AYC4_9GENT